MTLYAMSPRSDEPVGTLENGWSYLRHARELWALVDEKRASRLDAIQRRLDEASREELRLRRADLDALLGALDGLEAALVGAVLDQDWNIPAAEVDEVMRRAPSLAFRPRRSLVEQRAAAAEGLQRVLVLRHFLTEARDEGCEVLAD